MPVRARLIVLAVVLVAQTAFFFALVQRPLSVVGDNARLRYVTAQELDESSYVFGTQRARVARDGKLDWVVLGFGSGNGKIFQNTILDGEGAEGKVTGAYATRGRQHLDFDTTQEHAAPDA